MPTVIRDDSIGQALGTLASGLMGNPKDKWEAFAYKQRVLGMQAENAKTQMELENLRRQQQAQDGLVSAFDTTFQPQNFDTPQQIETPRPAPGVMGPMPAMPNPQYETLDTRLNFARTAARNAVLRGGNPGEALDAAYAALGMGGVLANGIPANELDARQTQTFLTGQIPDAKTPLTEQQRVVMAREAENAKLKEAVSIGANGTILTADQARVLNVPANEQGQFVLTPPPDPNNPNGGVGGPLGGNAVEAQAANILFNYQKTMRENPAAITPDMQMQASWAWNTLYGPKVKTVTTPGGGIDAVTEYPSTPGGFQPPGAPAMPAPAPVPPQPAPAVPGLSAAMPVPVQPQMPQVAQQPPSLAPQLPQIPGLPATAAPQPGAPGAAVQTLRPGVPEPNAEHVKRSATFINMMTTSLANMEAMFNEGFVPNGWAEVLGPLARPGGGSITNQAQTTLMNIAQGAIAPRDQVYGAYMITFLNAVLRDESGAAVPESEYPRYIAALIPSAGDGPELMTAKRMLMQQAVEARRRGLSLRDIHALVNPSVPLVYTDPATGQTVVQQPGGAGATAAPTPAPAAPPPGPAPAPAPAQTPPPVENDRVKLRQEADAAIATIDASGLDPREKERRKAVIRQRFNQMIGGQ